MVSLCQGPAKRLHIVSISSGCCNKAPETGWLETADVSSLLVLEAGNQKPRCRKGPTPSEASWGEPVLARMVQLLSGGCWQSLVPLFSLACCCFAPISFFLSFFPSFFLGWPQRHMEVSQAKGLIGAAAAGLRHSHSNSNTGSKLSLRPTPQLFATPDP